MKQWPNIHKIPIVLSLLFAPLTYSSTTSLSQDNLNLLAMTEQIIRDYRRLQAKCAEESNAHEKSMCYYRLRIKAWDYKESLTLSRQLRSMH